MCKVAPPSSLGTLSSFKNFVTNHYFNLLANVFDIGQLVPGQLLLTVLAIEFIRTDLSLCNSYFFFL